MKKIFALSLAVPLLALAACNPAASLDGDADDDASSNAAMDASSSSEAQETSSAASVATDGDDVRVVDVTVTDWTFSPATITVKQGENVAIRLVGDEGIHSLLVADLGLNVRVEPGSTTSVNIPTDKAGTFEGRCGVPCGPGHRDMKFTIVVE